MLAIKEWLSAAVCCALVASPSLAAEKANVDRLLAQLGDDSADVRQDAAAALADIGDPRIVTALRSRAAVEKDFHARLAIHYALASHGEKASLEPLIESLHKTGHMGANYLGLVTGEDYRWDIAWWQHWFEKTSEKDFRANALRRLERQPMMEEWQRFASLYSAEFFEQFDFDEPAGGDRRLSDADRKALEELPTAKAWGAYSAGLTALQQDGNRREAARHFRRVATEFPRTYYADESRELADLLEPMVAEDEKYKPPADIGKLALDEQIAHHVYDLRNVVAYQWTQPGYCHVLSDIDKLLDALEPAGSTDRKPPDAAQSLHKIGKPAVPALLKLLDDRRPIRGVGYWRNFHPSRTVLRHQDAAIQLLEAIVGEGAYSRRTTSSYFSQEKPERRAEIIETLRARYAPDVK